MTQKCCFEPLNAPDRCTHRQRYLDAEEYITSRGIKVTYHDHDWWAWNAARSVKDGNNCYIEVSNVAYKIYGWDVMTSVLIHGFGCCDLFSEDIKEGSSAQENLEIQKKANQRGLDIMPPQLVPEHYHNHRKFFLKSYSDKVLGIDWTKEKTLEEWSKADHE